MYCQMNHGNPSMSMKYQKLKKKLKHAHGPEILELKSLYDGPDHGLDYHEETGKFTIADGWHIEANGDIVRD